MIKEGTIWTSADNKQFQVIKVVEQNGHMWVHYRTYNGQYSNSEVKEYSCYLESFTFRFTEVVV